MTKKRGMAFPRWLGAVGLLCTLGFGGITPAAGRVHAANAGPTSSNTLTIGWAYEATTLDPAGYTNNPEIWSLVNVFDQLLRVAPDGKSLLPDLATSWDVTSAGTVYTFHLRPNVTFQNGTKLTAADVKFCLDRARNPKQDWSWTLAAIKSIAAPDPATVVVTLTHAWSPLLSDLALFDSGIYPEAYFNKVGASYMGQHPIGTGPYMMDQWKRGQYLLFKKNANYFNAAQYPMQYVKYELIPNDNTRLLEVETGALDVDNVLPYNLVAQVQSNPSAAVQMDPSTETNYIIFNNAIKPFNDPKVRQALSHSINRAAMVKAILYGHGSVANSFLPAGAIDYDPNIAAPTYDPALAKKLLSQSSVPHGFSMTMEVASGNAVWNEEAQIFQSEVAPMGITVHLVELDPNTLDQVRNTGKYHSTESLWTNDIPDPDEIVSFAVDPTTGGHSFYTWYDNPQLASLSHQAEQTSDSATRQKLYFQIQQIWAQDQPFVALYYNPFVNAVNKSVHGFSENPLGYFNLQGVTKS